MLDKSRMEVVNIKELELTHGQVTRKPDNSYYFSREASFIVDFAVQIRMENIFSCRAENIGTRSLPSSLVWAVVIISNSKLPYFPIYGVVEVISELVHRNCPP